MLSQIPVLSVVLSLALLLPATTTRASAGSPPAKPAAPAPAARTIVGEVVSVLPASAPAAAGPGAATVVLRETLKSSRPGDGSRGQETLSITVDSATQVLRGKRVVPLDDLKPGDHAVVRYAPGSPVGRAITVRVADVVTKPAAGAPAGPASPPAIGATN